MFMWKVVVSHSLGHRDLSEKDVMVNLKSWFDAQIYFGDRPLSMPEGEYIDWVN